MLGNRKNTEIEINRAEADHIDKSAHVKQLPAIAERLDYGFLPRVAVFARKTVCNQYVVVVGIERHYFVHDSIHSVVLKIEIRNVIFVFLGNLAPRCKHMHKSVV